LLDGAIGDVLAARDTASFLLSTLRESGPDPTLSRTILTAICLHVASKGVGEARRQDLTRYLQDLHEAGGASPSLVRSHMTGSSLSGARHRTATLYSVGP
jgi:hypothetical protein